MTRKVVIAALAVVVSGVVIGYAVRYPFFDFGKPTPQDPALEVALEVKSAFAVVIENAPVVRDPEGSSDPEREARPQWGLAEADVVFETLAEGGITRYMAIFETEEAKQIGPVRSLRPYFLDWALGFRVPFAFSGGSSEALARIENGADGEKAINEFFNEDTFWRDKSRGAPHNLFTSSGLMLDLLEGKGWTGSSFTRGWRTKDRDPVAGTPAASQIFVDIGLGSFAVEYRYDQSIGSYGRFLGGQPHADAATGAQLNTDNVVVLETTSRLLDQKLLTLDIETFGSGKAYIFQGGGVLQARWQKNSLTEPLRLVDADGSLVALNKGKTWFAVLDQSGNVSWK